MQTGARDPLRTWPDFERPMLCRRCSRAPLVLIGDCDGRPHGCDSFTLFLSPLLSPGVPRTSSGTSHLSMADDKKPVERGVSMDQDGKSNVWAIEPKMEIESKSSEEKTGGLLLAIGGIGAFAAIAGAVLSNLPDPNQF